MAHYAQATCASEVLIRGVAFEAHGFCTSDSESLRLPLRWATTP